jgi:pyruvate dehydrogenase phosphatase
MWKRLLTGGLCSLAGAVFSAPQEFGHVSYPANLPIEDRFVLGELCSGKVAAVFDGHGGWQVSEFLHRNVVQKIKEIRIRTQQDWQIVLASAFDELENQLRDSVRGSYRLGFAKVASVGSCAIVALVFDKHFVVANAGDCQAVVVSLGDNGVKGENICVVHSSNLKSEQERLAREHPGEEDIVRCKSPTACYVKGRLMPTRAFGDFHLKFEEFNNPENLGQVHGFNRSQIQRFTGPYVSHSPDIQTREIRAGDKFLILASDGLWDEMTEQEAAETIAEASSAQEAAEKLLDKALNHAAESNNMTRNALNLLPLGKRRSYHDDITVVVVPLQSGIS